MIKKIVDNIKDDTSTATFRTLKEGTSWLSEAAVKKTLGVSIQTRHFVYMYTVLSINNAPPCTACQQPMQHMLSHSCIF